MCGITGVVDHRGVSAEETQLLLSMTHRLDQRGPDGYGVWGDQLRVAFGHTRLAILDLAGGGQPMHLPGRDMDHEVVVTFGGEIYNFRELCAELRALGHTISDGDGDTEVLLHAYAQWGPAFVERLRGMFAFALWDAAERKLLLVRDPLGVKPLYYQQLVDEQGNPCGVVFASEVKAMMAHPQVTARVDVTGLNELFAMTPMQTPGLTPLAGIREVRPGHMVTVAVSGLRETAYWTLTAVDHEDDQPTTVAKIREMLETISQQQVRSHRTVACLLSGGIDSSATTALTRKYTSGRLHTFCVEYAPGDGPDYGASPLHVDSDAPWAQIVARHLDRAYPTYEVAHHRVMVSLDDMAGLADRTAYAFEWPSFPHVNTPLTRLFQEVSGYAPVVISAEGADEIFGGYKMHYDPEHYGPSAWPWARTYPTPAVFMRRDVYNLLRPDDYLAERYLQARELAPVPTGLSADERARRVAAHQVLTHYLPFLLRRADRLSMTWGVEVRVPFCDHELVQYAYNIPSAMHSNNGQQPKDLLRRAVADLLPGEVVKRPKSGFPVATTRRYQAELWAHLRKLIGRRGPLSDLIDWPRFEAMLDRTEGDVSDWTCLLHGGWVAEMVAWEDAMGLTLA